MNYISTRGGRNPLPFDQIALTGLAPDGGLYVPESWPHFDAATIAEWKDLPYTELAFKVMFPFVDGSIPAEDFRAIVNKSYTQFRHAEVTPLHHLTGNHHILELFHGPTLAFKDVALQFLGALFDYLLEPPSNLPPQAGGGKVGGIVVIGATSGDTGSAAIEGCRRSKHIRLFMLHPKGRVSEVQRRQMTTVLSPNIHNLAVEGTFDDCQTMVKQMFGDAELNEKYSLVAVNSINWARIMAQIVYYFYAALKLGAPEKAIAFSVPTGNFGDIFAGYVAQKMGLPISRLIIATNSNDILHRFLSANDYRKTGVSPTLSPSMDIQISSNFERLLFDLYGGVPCSVSGVRQSSTEHAAPNTAGAKIKALMQDFDATGKFAVDSGILDKARQLFASHATDDATIKAVIKAAWEESSYLLDPHTATGVNAAFFASPSGRGRKSEPFAGRISGEGAQAATTPSPGSASHPLPEGEGITVTLATAHPAKFPDAVESASGVHPELPEHLADLLTREERLTPLPGDLATVKEHILKTLG